jgi:hypothetical protein
MDSYNRGKPRSLLRLLPAVQPTGLGQGLRADFQRSHNPGSGPRRLHPILASDIPVKIDGSVRGCTTVGPEASTARPR